MAWALYSGGHVGLYHGGYVGSSPYGAWGKGAMVGVLYAVCAMLWGIGAQGYDAHAMGVVSCGDIRGAVCAMIWGCIIMGRGAVASMARGILKLGGPDKGMGYGVARCALVPLTAPVYQNPLGSCKHPKIQP